MNKVEVFDALLNEMFKPMDKALLIFALRYNYHVYLFGEAATGKTVLYRTLFHCGFEHIDEAGKYGFGPEYIPFNITYPGIALMTKTFQKIILRKSETGRSYDYFNDSLMEIRDYIMSGFDLTNMEDK